MNIQNSDFYISKDDAAALPMTTFRLDMQYDRHSLWIGEKLISRVQILTGTSFHISKIRSGCLEVISVSDGTHDSLGRDLRTAFEYDQKLLDLFEEFRVIKTFYRRFPPSKNSTYLN